MNGKSAQLELFTWGGPRRGAGRKPKSSRAGVAHEPRERVTRHVPVHVTLRLRDGLPRLRNRAGHRLFLRSVLAARERLGARVVHWSLQQNHVHLIVEAEGTDALARAMAGLSIRFARAFNREHHRTGRVLADRYHARALRTPLEVRRTVLYVLANARHHGDSGPGAGRRWVDPLSSALWFEGWADAPAIAVAWRHDVEVGVLAEARAARDRRGRVPEGATPYAPARSWLLDTGWRRHGLLSTTAAPGAKAAAAG